MMIDEVNGDDDEGSVEIWHSPTLLQLKRVVICHSHYLDLSNHDDDDCKRECKSYYLIHNQNIIGTTAIGTLTSTQYSSNYI